jgi:hypothetical protein
MERKRIEKFWLDVAFDRIPDLVLAFLVAVIFQGGIRAFFEIFLWLQLLYLAVWLRNSLWSWVKYSYRDKESKVRNAVKVLTESSFPQTRQIDEHAEDYFGQIVADDALQMETRLRAARQLGAFDYLVENLRAQEYLRLTYTLEEAIQRHNEQPNSTAEQTPT